MKKAIRFLCIILVCSLLIVVPARAESTVESRGSAFFAAYGTDLYKTSSSSFQIWFDVDANAWTSMQEIGASEIVVYRSSDQQSWTKMRTYDMDDYSQMVAYNTGSHIDYVTYNYATSGYYYRARVTFYAKNSTGVGERDVYTEILHM
ncbi:MAG: hypothetical protein IJX37_01875 [Oscillospiraceae bacterium]|nr:hypothetical protein [Oscillospiraceae bacterium]